MSKVPRETLVQYQPASQKAPGEDLERSRKQPMTSIDPKSTIGCKQMLN